jgi:hypothetical protein
MPKLFETLGISIKKMKIESSGREDTEILDDINMKEQESFALVVVWVFGPWQEKIILAFNQSCNF